MGRMIDQIRALKLPSNMMQFAARGALSVPPDENLEILVYLAEHNKVFGDLARMTLAGWDEKASLVAACDPKTAQEVLKYLVSPENLRPKLLPALLENPSVPESELAKSARSASPESITTMLESGRVQASKEILKTLRSNPYSSPDQAAKIAEFLSGGKPEEPVTAAPLGALEPADSAAIEARGETVEPPEEAVTSYLAEHASEISAEEGRPFQPIGGILDLLGADYFPVSAVREITSNAEPVGVAGSAATKTVRAEGAKPGGHAVPGAPVFAKRENTMQKIGRLDVKGRIQLALKGNKEERSILIRDGTKVVALAVLEAPKLSDGEVEKFALQKNVLEAVLRQIPLKRRFMKNYIVVRNLVANPRTPLDLGLGLMKHLLMADLKNLSSNKEVSETVRNLASKMYKQKLDTTKKK
jgi:hypothetical protein